MRYADRNFPSLATVLAAFAALAIPVAQAARPGAGPGCIATAISKAAGAQGKAANRFSDSDLVAAAIALRGGTSPQFFSARLRAELKALAEVKSDQALLKDETLSKVLEKLESRMGSDDFEQVLGSQVSTVKRTLASSRKTDSGRFMSSWQADTHDMTRGYGWKLLPDDDKAFNDPVYLANLLRQSEASGEVWGLRGQDLLPRKLFNAEWKKMAPNTQVIAFHLTGTDANNYLYDIAEQLKIRNSQLAEVDSGLHYQVERLERRIAQLRKDSTVSPAALKGEEEALRQAQARLDVHKRRWTQYMQKLSEADSPLNNRPAEILAFDGVYAGGGGRIGELGFLGGGRGGGKFLLPSPHTAVWKPTDATELARLKKLEDEALAVLERKVTGGEYPVGGLLVEPVVGAKGVFFYRPEFMRRLRALCDELRVPIFADEILTGGGRTGKFFAYQHYPGFEPDFITFGKGLQVAGVAKVERSGSVTGFHFYQKRDTTLRHYNEALLKAAQIMKRIREDNLMSRAEDSGRYLLGRLRAAKARYILRNAEEAVASLKRDLSEAPTARDTILADYRLRLDREKKRISDPQELQLRIRRLELDRDRELSWLQDTVENSGRRLPEAEAVLKRLKKEGITDQLGPDNIRGIGLLISSDHNPGLARAAGNRLMAPLTLTRKQIDELVK